MEITGLRIEALKILEKGSAPSKVSKPQHKFPFYKGDILKGKVVEVGEDRVTVDFGRFQVQARWEASTPVKLGMLLKVKVSSLYPKIQMKILEELVPGKMESLDSWAPLVEELLENLPDLPLIRADAGQETILEELVNFISKNGLSTEALMAKWIKGEVDLEDIKKDMKVQLLRALEAKALSGKKGEKELIKNLLDTIQGHQLFNLRSLDLGFILFPLLLIHGDRVEEWIFHMAKGDKNTPYRLVLIASPSHLGPIRVEIIYLEGTKELSIRFFTEKREAKNIISKELPSLKEAFKEFPFNLVGVRVELSPSVRGLPLPVGSGEGQIISAKV